MVDETRRRAKEAGGALYDGEHQFSGEGRTASEFTVWFEFLDEDAAEIRPCSILRPRERGGAYSATPDTWVRWHLPAIQSSSTHELAGTRSTQQRHTNEHAHPSFPLSSMTAENRPSARINLREFSFGLKTLIGPHRPCTLYLTHSFCSSSLILPFVQQDCSLDDPVSSCRDIISANRFIAPNVRDDERPCRTLPPPFGTHLAQTWCISPFRARKLSRAATAPDA